ncbi:MAG: DNA mismatch repair endonuclease MutL [Candidatus Zixiibacteriota bacterium]
MPDVAKLPEHIANRIAAGEVVERPASIVKELVENSIDARASHIEVNIVDGGKELIEIVDDGIGMTIDDLEMAIQRHTTSKIADVEDLDRIVTLGFRGEALPSIASVARIEITTRLKGSDLGSYIIIEDGDIIEKGQTGAKEGTRIEVKRLFDHVPARKKFLKTANTEYNHISKVLRGIALAHYDIGFRFLRGGSNEIFHLPMQNKVIDRIDSIFGKEVSNELVPVEASSTLLNVWGFVGRPGIWRSRSDMQYFIINGRHIHNRTITAALRKALGTLMPKGKHPVAFLYLEIAPNLVDVNVHPSKYEVRFRRENIVFQMVHRAVRDAFSPERFQSGFQKKPDEQIAEQKSCGKDDLRYAKRKSDFDLKASQAETVQLLLPLIKKENQDRPKDSDEEKKELLRREIASSIGDDIEKPHANFYQLHKLFIVTEIGDGIIIVDQHAAHERILYERVMKSMKESRSASQRLLFPLTVPISAVQKEVIDRYNAQLEKIGFEMGFSDSQYRVTLFGIPQFMRSVGDGSLFLEMLDEIYDGMIETEDVAIHFLASSISCKAAIKAGDELSESEMNTLFNQLFATQNPYSCPHGRPTIIKLTMAELYRRFGRTQ